MTPGAFYEAVLALCVEYEASMTSGRRTPRRNARKGGKPRSRHLEGLALDVVPDDLRRMGEIARAAQARGIGALVERDHVHLQVRRARR